jgi:dephospho-CoA kinase
MSIGIAVVVAGEICSGKSTVIAHLARVHDWDVISFGDYVRHVSARRGLTGTREELQSLGAELLDGLGPEQLLDAAVRLCQPRSSVHLFDGVRHASMLAAIRQRYSTTVVAYLDVTAAERYRRFLRRQREDETTLTHAGFMALCDAPIERSVLDVRTTADLLFADVTTVEEVARAIECLVGSAGKQHFGERRERPERG